MVKSQSTMLPLGSPASDFSLPDLTGQPVSLSEIKVDAGLLIAFVCNHCPFVKHVREVFSQIAKDYQAKGIPFIAINSNDVEAYPDDHPDEMRRESKLFDYTFPYLFDESQEVAKAYRAACTPDFFLFDGERKLVYRGQMDSSRPGNDIPVTGEDLKMAMDHLLTGNPPLEQQRPSIGCNIKWKPGNAPDYFSSP